MNLNQPVGVFDHRHSVRRHLMNSRREDKSPLPNLQGSAGFDLAQLEAFLAVADSGSLKAAAELIGRDVAVVSRRLKALETRLGIRLVERNTRRAALTAAGEAYRETTAPLVRALREAEHDLAVSGAGTPKGHLRVAVPGSFSQFWLREMIVGFLADHPEVTMECEVANRYVDLIAERFDVAIRLGVLPDSGLVARRAASRRRLLCAAPALVARLPELTHPGQLAGLPCLRTSNHREPRRWSMRNAAGEEASVTVTGPLASDDACIVVEAAVAGLGVLFTGEWYVSQHLRDGSLVRVLPDWSSGDDAGVFVVTPASSGISSAARAFSDWMVGRLSAEPWTV